MKYCIRLDMGLDDPIPYVERHNAIIYAIYCMTDGNGKDITNSMEFSHKRLEGTYKRLQQKYPPYKMGLVVMPSPLTVINMSKDSNAEIRLAAEAITLNCKLDSTSLRNLFYAWAKYASPNK